jgi:hypothetical protein
MFANTTLNNKVANVFIFFGAVVPYLILTLSLFSNGFDIPLLLGQTVSTPGAAFFTADVVLSALFVIYLAATNTAMGNKRYWVITVSLLVGPSCALPLYFRLR